MTAARGIFTFAGHRIPRGQSRNCRIKISETYTGAPIEIPVRVITGRDPGPTLFVTAAVHGDEVNGVGIVHDLMFARPPRLRNGALIMVPVVNCFGFESHERYLPDRRDLNRSFPGNVDGSLASRLAATVMSEVVARSDYGIDLHSAATQRTNFPNVRADLDLGGTRRLARAFGAALIVDGKGPTGSLRREACKAGCPTIILEAGEPGKIEPSVLEIGVRGVRNVLIDLGMIDGTRTTPPFQTYIRKTLWVRSPGAGLLKFHIGPGDFLEAGEAIATLSPILGSDTQTLHAPDNAIVLSVATLPAVKPGEPVCLLAFPTRRFSSLKRQAESSSRGMHNRARTHLATNIHVVQPVESDED
ncbi:MAG: succinylglutamate desuccinylase/aspartoacylase family protein [Opitutales bacterium]